MKKYAEILDNETGLCGVALGNNITYYKSVGMTLLDVKQSDIDNLWYLTEKCKMKTSEQKAIEEKERIMKLSMTPLDFLNALEKYGVDYDTVKSLCEQNAEVDKQLRFCSRVYRFNPLLNKLGEQFGLTPEVLNKIFIDYGE